MFAVQRRLAADEPGQDTRFKQGTQGEAMNTEASRTLAWQAEMASADLMLGTGRSANAAADQSFTLTELHAFTDTARSSARYGPLSWSSACNGRCRARPRQRVGYGA